MKERADRLVVQQGLAATRHKAQALIMAGLVYSRGERIEKAGRLLSAVQPLHLKHTIPYVSRGGLKLEEALKRFAVVVRGKCAADLGASTGGFTDCLLQNGAKRVYAVDVDTRQLDWKLQQDPRVVPIQKNARFLSRGDFPERQELLTMDLSFISVLKVLPAVREILEDAPLISLIKPQFEAGIKQVGRKGIIRNRRVHEDVLNTVLDKATRLGFSCHGLIPSPLLGQKGNREFFVLWQLKPGMIPEDGIRTLIKEAVGNEKD